ncbi:CHAT domain-containing tetratricopeptide repeat protein [Nostoc sphaeroides]|uniref:CHAT domain-containing protein n=1 Tax=Nostoc sphaeroides CCNUC1 TaxID=2653204 RepID=A0A5P8W3B3_9NOSO|nr:CHAT domain-containing protein [Nostoc sphaeroides]QFS47094.1 CHAT domain-containing protein [Nostoc sphaeroides CCNUC1]
MKKNAKFECNFCCSFSQASRYSLTVLLSVVFLSDAVGATSISRWLQIRQQMQADSQKSIDAAVEQGYTDSFSEKIAKKVSANVKIAQSPDAKPQNTNPAPSEAEAKIKPLWDKAHQLLKEGDQLQKQPSAAAVRQAITKYEEALKIWRLPEVRAAKPQEAPFVEAVTLSAIGNSYTILTENTKAVGYLEQALAIVQESQESQARKWKPLLLTSLGGLYRQLGEKQKAIDAYNQAQSLYHADKQPKEEADVLWSIALVYKVFGEPKKEREFLERALVIQKANDDLPGQGKTLWAIALNYQVLGETNKELDYYQQALKIYSQTKDLLGQAETFTYIGSVYSDRGDRSSAEKYFQQALELQKTNARQIKQDTTNPFGRINFFNSQMRILSLIATGYFTMGDTQQQIVYLNQARNIAHELGRTQDEAQLISSIGTTYYFLGETQKAYDNFEQALKLQREIKDFQGEAKTLVNIASIYKKSGEFQQALDQLNQALEISKQKQNSLLEGQIIFDMSSLYIDLGAYELGIEKSKEVLAIFQKSNPSLVRTALYSIGVAYLGSCFYQKKPEDCRQSLNYSNQALKYAPGKGSVSTQVTILNITAKAYEFLEDYPQAITNAKQALELSRKYSFKEDQNNALAFLSTAYEGAGDYKNALDANKQSLSLSQQLGDLRSQATVYRIRGKIYTSMKQPQQAIEAYNQELKLRQQISNTSNQTYSLYKIAIIERDRGNLNQAKTHIETVINITENTRSKVNSDDLRSSYFATVQDYYKFYIDLLMQLHKKDPSKGYNALALHISERSRARVLVELLKESNVNLRKDVEPQLLAEERRLNFKLNAKDKFLSDLFSRKEPPTELIAKTKQEITNIIQESQSISEKIRATNPERAELIDPKDVLELSGIQQQLDQDTVMLQYSLGEERSYLWVVTPNSLESYELPAQEKIAKAANKFNSFVKQPLNQGATAEDNAEAVANTGEAADALSQIILAPVAGKLGNKRLVIVADGILHQVPFAALNEPRKSSASAEYQPLVVNHEIVNLPSISSIATHRKKLKGRKIAPKTLAVLANPVFTVNDVRLKNDKPSTIENNLDRSTLETSLRNINKDKLDPLPGTKDEGEAILSLVNSPGEKLSAFDFDANYNFATSKQLSQYRYLLFATHGIFDPVNPGLSGIVLSLVDKQGKPQTRGFLRLNDIFNLDLPAELIVLSACESGLGDDVQGEGLVGLTRGFMYAGAARVTVSLWNVNDQSTKELMIGFYKQILEQKKSPAAALNVAQRQMWQGKDLQNPEWKHPRYWAAFTLQGEWR